MVRKKISIFNGCMHFVGKYRLHCKVCETNLFVTFFCSGIVSQRTTQILSHLMYAWRNWISIMDKLQGFLLVTST